MKKRHIIIDYTKWKGSKENKLSYEEILSYPGKGKPPILCNKWQDCKQISTLTFFQYNKLLSIQRARVQQRACNGWDKFILKNLNNIKQHPFEYHDETAKEQNLLRFSQPILTESTINELSSYEYSSDTEGDSDKEEEDYYDENKKSAYEMRSKPDRDYPNKSPFSPLL